MNIIASKTLFGLQLMGMILAMSAFNHNVLQKASALEWLVGTWTVNTSSGVVVEKWTILNDSTLTGSSILIKAQNDTIPQELLVLSNRNSQWTYTSTVEGQNNNRAIVFKVIFLKGTEFICENPAHDFPQRIAYRRVGDALFASIEGKKGKNLRKQNFDFVSVKTDR